MKRKRYTEEQIIGYLKQHEAGMPTKEVIRQAGITEQTFYRWKNKYGGMEVSDAKKLRSLEEENRRLKRLVADQALDIQILRACGLFGLQQSSWYYRAKGRDDHALKAALARHAAANPGWGYRGLMDWLIRDGFTDNHKRVYRVYAEAGLQLGRRKRRQKTRYRGSKLDQPAKLNELWTMDFLSDQLEDGRVFRLLVVLDVFSRRCLAIEADTSIGGQRVARLLDRIKGQHGLPKVIGTDNGPEFRSRHMDQWAYRNKVKLHFIKPGTPTQNAFIESLNSQIRKRLLDEHWFRNLDKVRHHAERWRITYNTVKRHGSLGKQTPEQFAAHCRLRSATPPFAGNEPKPTNTLVRLT